MFSARKNDVPSEASFAMPASAAPMTNAKPFAAYAEAADSNCSIINEWLTMRGDLESSGDILVRGRIFGNVACKLLIIDREAHVEGGITVDEVVIRGAARGTIKAKRVRVEKTAVVDSEISHEMFSAEEGARVRGTLSYREMDEAIAPARTERTDPPSMPSGGSTTPHSPLFNMLEAARTNGQNGAHSSI